LSRVRFPDSIFAPRDHDTRGDAPRRISKLSWSNPAGFSGMPQAGSRPKTEVARSAGFPSGSTSVFGCNLRHLEPFSHPFP
jgi:hypothetical protein